MAILADKLSRSKTTDKEALKKNLTLTCATTYRSPHRLGKHLGQKLEPAFVTDCRY